MSWISKNEEHKNRDNWEFQFTVAEVMKGVTKKIDHHSTRQAWWENELEQAEAGLKDRGFEYRERRNSAGEELVVVGDPELANRVKECSKSIRRHTDRRQDYETWHRVLASQQAKKDTVFLPLKYGDIEYFGL